MRFSLYLSLQAIVGDDTYLDPSETEARASSGTVILACMPALDSITSIWQSGHMTADMALKVTSLQFITSNANNLYPVHGTMSRAVY